MVKSIFGMRSLRIYSPIISAVGMFRNSGSLGCSGITGVVFSREGTAKMSRLWGTHGVGLLTAVWAGRGLFAWAVGGRGTARDVCLGRTVVLLTSCLVGWWTYLAWGAVWSGTHGSHDGWPLTLLLECVSEGEMSEGWPRVVVSTGQVVLLFALVVWLLS